MKVEKGLTVRKLVEILRAFPQDMPVQMEIELENKFVFREITHIDTGSIHSEPEKVFITHRIDWE